jgi:glycosyltransferase 2 family protein
MVTQAIGSLWVRLAITLAILAYLGSQLDMSAAARAVLRIDLRYLAVVLCLVALDRSIMILRWLRLLRASDVNVRTSQAVSIFLVSSFVGSFLPAGVGGDMARAYGLSRATSASSEALASVAVDRVLGILALLVMGLIGLALWTPATATDWRAPILFVLVLAACAAAFWADRVGRLLIPRSFHGWGVVRRLLNVGDAVGRYRSRPGVLLRVMGWSVAVQVLRITQAYLLGLGLGIAVPFRYYLVFMPIGLLMLLLPISVSGFGLPQGVIVWLLRPMRVADEQSFALSTLIVLTGLAGNLPGLVLWLKRDRG